MTLAVSIAQGGTNNVTMRNRVINGGMMIDQRNAGASTTPTTNGTYTLDRWQAGLNNASKYSVQQSSVAPTGFSNSILVTSLAATTVAAGDYYSLLQAIEGFNTADLNWGSTAASAGQVAKTITISFWVRSSLTGTFGGWVQNANVDRSYPFSYTISSANTWEQKTVTIAGDTAGTWVGATNGVGMYVGFSLGMGSTRQGTANTWAAANYRSVTGETPLVGTNTATLYITGVQLEAGTTATAFEQRLYGTELQLCQRYWERIGYGSDIVIGGYQVTNGLIYVSFSHAVPKRNPPTVLKLGTWTVSSSTQPTVSSPTTWGFRAYITANATGTIYALNDSTSLYFSSDAEL